MDSSTVDVPVFADTNLDTHFAVVVSPDITAGKFKRDLESVHLSYFPEIGNIRVHGLMVKRRSCFYHLPETLPIKHAFQGIKGTWFISVEAYPSENYKRKIAKSVAEEVQDHIFNNVTGTKRKNKKWKRKKRKKRKRKRFYSLKFVLQELFRSFNLPKKTKRRKILKACRERKGNVHVEEQNHPCSSVPTPSQTLSEPISVSGIIEKYFSGYDEVNSRSLGQFRYRTDDRIPKCAEKTPPAMMILPFPANGRSGTSRDKLGKGKIGNALVLASDSLGISASKQRPTVSLCRFSHRKVSKNLVLNSSTLVRSLVFEISDGED